MSIMVGSWEIERLESPSKWFALSRSYLDASIYLCQGMVNGSFISSFANAQVIMGLCHHSVELFYKGVLHSVTGEFPNATHNLFDLDADVKRLAPDVASCFSCPFGLEELPSCLLETEIKKRIGKTQDQQFRYQFDRDGRPWEGVHGFISENFLEVLNYCSSQYDVIIPKIIR